MEKTVNSPRQKHSHARRERERATVGVVSPPILTNLRILLIPPTGRSQSHDSIFSDRDNAQTRDGVTNDEIVLVPVIGK